MSHSFNKTPHDFPPIPETGPITDPRCVTERVRRLMLPGALESLGRAAILEGLGAVVRGETPEWLGVLVPRGLREAALRELERLGYRREGEYTAVPPRLRPPGLPEVTVRESECPWGPEGECVMKADRLVMNSDGGGPWELHAPEAALEEARQGSTSTE